MTTDTEAEAVGETGTMPGTEGFTMAVFEAAKVPVGTPLYGPAVLTAIGEQAARIVELEAERNAALRECGKWARQAGEAIGKLETSEAAGIVDGWKTRALKAEGLLEEGLLEEAVKPITMQDVRLFAGEGPLKAQTVLDACNAVLRHVRARAIPARQTLAAIKEK